MENIEIFKKKFTSFFAEKYYNKTREELDETEMIKCSYLAEMAAYIHSVVPEGFGDYTIFDFDGYAINKADNTTSSAMPGGIALAAKDKICKYCWGLKWEDISKQKEKDAGSIGSFLRKNSKMTKRSGSGSNIVIYGLSDRPIGRTMLASIVMKEAIRLRVTRRMRRQSYDWITFSQLFHAIEKDTMALADYKSCDWLVVDDIIRKPRSVKQTTLMSDLIDPFFLERLYNRQPTILVFKFDIRDRSFDMEKTFGNGIAKIVNNRRTLRIPLSEDLLRGVNE